MDQLRRLAALREADRAQIPADELSKQSRRLAECARTQPELRVDQRRIPERDRPLRARRRVVADDRRVDSEQLVRELAGIRDRRRREQELRIRAVDPREPPQPPEHVRDMRSEDAAVDVRLVRDDVAQVVEEVGPEIVARQHADMEHVGVRQHEIRPAANLRPPFLRRVAVVDRGAHAWNRQLAEAARLVLRERLRRIEVERAALRVGGERVEYRQVERERLAGRGSGRDDDVPTRDRRLVRLSLVLVELGDPAARERVAKLGAQSLGDRRRARRTRRGGRQVRELLALQQLVPKRNGGHSAIEAVPSRATSISFPAVASPSSAPTGATTASNRSGGGASSTSPARSRARSR